MHPQTQSTFTLKTVVTIFTLALCSIGLANTANSAIEFTPAEQAYITQSSGIKMCVDPDWAPFEQIDPQGQHEGIAADLVQLVAQRVGLQINLLPVKDWEESLAASKAKRCQVMSFLNQTPARDAWLIFTVPIFFDPNVIITREEHGCFKRRNRAAGYFGQRYQNHHATRAPSYFKQTRRGQHPARH
jgi:ABC-type amino acid transport substrate-binding protein